MLYDHFRKNISSITLVLASVIKIVKFNGQTSLDHYCLAWKPLRMVGTNDFFLSRSLRLLTLAPSQGGRTEVAEVGRGGEGQNDCCCPSYPAAAQLPSEPVRLFATPWTVARQAPPSMGFSRQEPWSEEPCPPPENLPDPRIEPRTPALQAVLSLSEPAGTLPRSHRP